MKAALGVWIDHRKALIVAVTEKGSDVKEVESYGEQQSGRMKNKRSPGTGEARKVPADEAQKKSRTGHLDKYYDNVITQLRDAKGIFIFGPDEAKDELVKRIETVNLGGCVTGVETAGRMTVPQIAAKVRTYIQRGRPARRP